MVASEWCGALVRGEGGEEGGEECRGRSVPPFCSRESVGSVCVCAHPCVRVRDKEEKN